MSIKIFCLFIYVHVYIGVFAQTKDLMTITESPLPQKIYLKNDYRLVVITTDEERILSLIGPNIDTVLKKISISTSPRYLGDLIGDYDDFFILLYPELEMSVFKKQNGQRLAHGTYLHEEDTINAVFYIDHQLDDQLGIFDFKTMKVELFNPLETSCQKWWVCIRKKTLSENQLILDYLDPNNNLKKKFYNRKP